MDRHAITSTVEEGKIILPPDIDWPSGTIVRIEPVDEDTLWNTLKQYTGVAEDLPKDLAVNHDHYLHGA
jgi:hypothetical protein